jgi:Tol biopolymer transport system component
MGSADRPQWSPDGTRIAFTDHSDAWRPSLELGAEFSNRWPIERVRVLDVATGKVTNVGRLGMATFWNAPRWVGNHSLFLNVARNVTNP